MIRIAKHHADQGTPLDVQDLFARFTLDTAGEFLFGTSDLNTLDSPLPQAGSAKLGPKGSQTDDEFGTFATAFEEGGMEVVHRALATDINWTIKQFFGDKLVGPQSIMDAYLMPLARKALDEKKARDNGKEASQEKSFLEHLAGSTDGEWPYYIGIARYLTGCMCVLSDIQVVRDQLLNILLAARDTVCFVPCYQGGPN